MITANRQSVHVAKAAYKNTFGLIIGNRSFFPDALRFSEKSLERAGITVEPLDLSEVFGRIQRLADDAPETKTKLEAIQSYVDAQDIPKDSLLKMAKFGAVVDGWMSGSDLAGTSVQCWTAMQEYFGVMPCTFMSLMSNDLLPSACETDIAGMIGMYVLQLASNAPSATVDWNSNYGSDPDKAVVFHCSNLPKHFLENARMDFNEIIATGVGKDKSFGTVVGKVKPGAITYCRVSTDDLHGRMRSYVGEGEVTSDPLKSFGGYGVVRIPDLPHLLHYVCNNGYEHHVCVNYGNHAGAIANALRMYKGWEVYQHENAKHC